MSSQTKTKTKSESETKLLSALESIVFVDEDCWSDKYRSESMASDMADLAREAIAAATEGDDETT